MPLAVRSGCHGISGRSTNDGGILIDLAELNQIELLDPATGRVRIGPGARWGEVAQTLGAHGLALSSGVDVDNHPELYWAIRGAGANFGIVTAFEFEAYPVDEVTFAISIFDIDHTADLLERWGRYVEHAPRELPSFLNLLPGRAGRGTVAQVTTVHAGGDTDSAQHLLEALADFGPLRRQQTHRVPYAASVAPNHNPHVGRAPMSSRSGLLEHLMTDAAQALGKPVGSDEVHLVQIRSVGGAVNDTPPEATAYAHRHQNFPIPPAT